MKQSLLYSFWIALFTGRCSFAIAQNSQPLYDCRLVTQEIDISTLASQLPYAQRYPTTNLQTALKNLRSFCCNEGILPSSTTSCQGAKNLTTYAHSPYLYDHLIDVAWRALDGTQALQYPGATLNAKGKEWRTFINEAGNLGQGTQPRLILETFRNQRIYSDSQTNLQECNTFQGIKTQMGLAEDYKAVCALSQCISQSILEGNGGIPNLSAGRKVNPEIVGLRACQTLANQRFHQEVQLVKAQMMQTSSRMLKTVSNTYLNEYLTQGRMTTLLEKFSQMEAAFSTITTKVSEGTRMCNK